MNKIIVRENSTGIFENLLCTVCSNCVGVNNTECYVLLNNKIK